MSLNWKSEWIRGRIKNKRHSPKKQERYILEERKKKTFRIKIDVLSCYIQYMKLHAGDSKNSREVSISVFTSNCFKICCKKGEEGQLSASISVLSKTISCLLLKISYKYLYSTKNLCYLYSSDKTSTCLHQESGSKKELINAKWLSIPAVCTLLDHSHSKGYKWPQARRVLQCITNLQFKLKWNLQIKCHSKRRKA